MDKNVIYIYIHTYTHIHIYIHIYIYIYIHTHTHTKERLPFVIIWMNLKVIMLSEISQTEKINIM